MWGWRVAIAILVLVAACGTRPPVREGGAERTGSGASEGAPADAASPARAPVPCGARTCGPDEYCESKCTCCGIRIPDPSQASGTLTCKPLPPSCHGANGPECQQRKVEMPCA
jgi:hypothetical protein